MEIEYGLIIFLIVTNAMSVIIALVRMLKNRILTKSMDYQMERTITELDNVEKEILYYEVLRKQYNEDILLFADKNKTISVVSEQAVIRLKKLHKKQIDAIANSNYESAREIQNEIDLVVK